MIDSAARRRGRPPRPLPWAMAAALVLLDQMSKHWALRDLPLAEVRPFLPGLLQLQRVYNTGAAFSLFADATPVLALISTGVSLAVALWLLRNPPERPWQALAAGFLLGGAIGNGIDRWRLGAVVDFLEFVPISFPIFNLADVAINLAVACFLIDLLLPVIRSRRRGAPDRDA